VTVITLADGRKFDTVKKIALEDMSSDTDNVSEDLPIVSPKSNIRLEDLPAAPKIMNVVCAVASYKILGISDSDICIALGCSPNQLQSILEGDIYDKTYNDILAAFVRGQENSARDILARASMSAANTLVTIASKSKNEQNKLKAAESILNRMNITGDDNHGMAGPGLTIKIIKDTKDDSITISM
jgi:hypothetical protein